jgi:predicted nucleotidyltransferase
LASNPNNPNIELLLTAIHKLEPLLEQIVFVGGCVTGLLLTDPGAAPARASIDVDVIVEAVSYPEFAALETQLGILGFHQTQETGDPVCRWLSDNLVLDFMPIDPTILGFSNRWYRPTFENSSSLEIAGKKVRLITAPYFLATKLEAFHGRGRNDYRSSHDLEDVITVIDGRAEVVEEVRHSEMQVQRYLSDRFSSLISSRDFLDALPGHLLPDTASQDRAGLVLQRMRDMVVGA